jgi:hypothetical protein
MRLFRSAPATAKYHVSGNETRARVHRRRVHDSEDGVQRRLVWSRAKLSRRERRPVVYFCVSCRYIRCRHHLLQTASYSRRHSDRLDRDDVSARRSALRARRSCRAPAKSPWSLSTVARARPRASRNGEQPERSAPSIPTPMLRVADCRTCCFALALRPKRSPSAKPLSLRTTRFSWTGSRLNHGQRPRHRRRAQRFRPHRLNQSRVMTSPTRALHRTHRPRSRATIARALGSCCS